VREGDVIDQIRETLSTRRDERAIEYDGQWISWGEVARYGDAIIDLLGAAGCPSRGRVGVIIRNRAAHAAAVIGLIAHRRSVSFLYPFLPPAVLAEQIASLDATAIVADAIDWPLIEDAVARAGSAGISLGSVDDAPRCVEGLEHPRDGGRKLRPDDEGSIEVLSSGTTGTPKRIAMPLHILNRAVQSAPGQEAGSNPPVQINIWPLGGVGGMCLLAFSAAKGIPHVLIERFSVEEFVSAIKRHRPPMLGVSPTAISMVMDANVPPEDLSSVKIISGGSAHLDPDLQDRFEARYGIPILWAMGATEFCGTIIRWTPEMREKVGAGKRGSIGMAMPDVELRVVDPETGEMLPPGVEGLMEVYCPIVRPDWVRTTDLVVVDEDGYVFHRGRNDGAIVRGGFKILPERVVEILRQHPSVADASVVGMPDARLGEVPVAVVELVPGAAPITESALLDHIRTNLPPTHVPTRLLLVDTLPRTPSLKVSLADVKRIFETGAA
jgi:acyl-CoA synthetase (AMP-forming)/AMP-acid ligase II